MKKLIQTLSLSAILAVILFCWGCAGVINSMQSTSRKTVNNPPYYRNFENVSISSEATVKMLAVTAPQKQDWYTPSLSPLLAAINTYLADEQFVPMVNMPQFRQKEAPAVVFGHALSVLDLSEDEKDQYEEVCMMLEVTQPSKNWKLWWQENRPSDTDYLVYTELVIGAYKVSQKDWKGNKEIRIGSDYSVAVPWLTSLDDPVAVVQLTGALLSKEGKVIRAGAEGIFVKPNSFIRSVLGMNELIDKEDVQYIIYDHKREDLDNSPLAYKVAAKNLLDNLIK